MRITIFAGILAAHALFGTAGCCEREPVPRPSPAEVDVVTVQPETVPVTAAFVAQVKSSHQVEVMARVNDFLEKVLYREGVMMKEGQVMFQMDRKPILAQVDALGAAGTPPQNPEGGTGTGGGQRPYRRGQGAIFPDAFPGEAIGEPGFGTVATPRGGLGPLVAVGRDGGAPGHFRRHFRPGNRPKPSRGRPCSGTSKPSRPRFARSRTPWSPP